MKANFKSILFGICLFLIVTVGTGWSQSSTAAINGQVVDASGAAVAGATVTARNNGTNATDTATSDDTGYFRIGKLSPASYTVTIEASGFAAYTAQQVIVQIGSVTEISPKLNIASAGATVEVTAELPVINTTSQDFSNVVDEKAIVANLVRS